MVILSKINLFTSWVFLPIPPKRYISRLYRKKELLPFKVDEQYSNILTQVNL